MADQFEVGLNVNSKYVPRFWESMFSSVGEPEPQHCGGAGAVTQGVSGSDGSGLKLIFNLNIC
jgi:hypothetical protein